MKPDDHGERAAHDPPADAHEGETPEQLRARIERTRGDMSETIDAIQERLDPERLKEQVKESVREATIGRAEQMVSEVTEQAREKGYDMLDTIKENPIPAALIGIGLGWMLMKGSDRRNHTVRYVDRYEPGGPDYASYREYRRQPGRGATGRGGYPDDLADSDQSGLGAAASQAGAMAGQVGDTARRTVGSAGDRVHDIAGQAGGKVQDIAGQAGEAAQQIAGQAGDKAQQLGTQAQQVGVGMRYRVTRARSSLEGLLEESPLAVGAIALAAGAAIGLAFPSTEQENQLMGEARDTLMHQAQETAQQTLDKVQHVAGAVQDTARDEARKAGLT